ncbi:pyridoxamine 5'-phosphate oxidase family protein [Kitasatospora sp. CM 4170]|uniref:Helix-turn-helix domain-containing protein n=1 Tax=Kitasatospora aburaviensis TaxID=67265 RepID=A0ABW1F8B8_9ACTN|nr:pyridoxamine 5'-phosphate oxidase family protein [Kitasatospora sp. CM 4170]WNM43591.1 pyridoxamine 5'-phosphate oxidase family protein [Kitasatospora sp. CM 4170]
MNTPDREAVQKAEPADVARRVRERRDQLGLTDEMLAYQAAMAPRYLRHLLDVGPAFDSAGFVRIAAALRMTWSELLEGRPDAPPGQGDPGPRPLLLHLTEPECWDLIGTHGIGRVGLPVQPAPAVFPVNYAVDARTIVYRTSAGGAAAPPDGSPVSFQVDHIDDRMSQGWSVLILGEAHHVEDADEQERLSLLPGTTPWAGAGRARWVRIRPDEVTGRRIGSG